MIDVSHPFFDTNLSWLSHNYQLLLEAKKDEVPSKERLRNLALYSDQIDEFFRIRIPMLLAMREVSKDILDKLNIYPDHLLEHILETVDHQLTKFDDLLTNEILPKIKKEGIHVYFKEELEEAHKEEVKRIFTDQIFRHVQPVFLEGRRSSKITFFEPNQVYLVLRLQRRGEDSTDWYAYVNVPVQQVGRFYELSEINGQKYVAFLEDIIQANFNTLFPGYDVFDCFALRAEEETELFIEDEYPPAVAQRIVRQLEKKNFIRPHQYFYEMGMPSDMRGYLSERVGILQNEFHERGRYLYYQDLQHFPSTFKKLEFSPQLPIPHVELSTGASVFEVLNKGDQLLHLPYHSIQPVVRFFNEAAVDPFVREIYISLYKINSNSFLVNSLISAARNGKRVVTFVEMNAKLDIQENLQLARKMKEAGVKIIFSSPGLKVHGKVALVKRKGKKGWDRYAYLGTGGFYRMTSREFVNHALLTSHRDITNELELLFSYLVTSEEPKKYKYLPFNYLHVSQFNMNKRLIELIDREIANSKAGLRASIFVKINQLQDQAMIMKLYQAGQAGVSVTLIVSESCCLIPELPTISDNIVIMRLVDRYTENSRIFVFHNRGKEDVFLSSGDWTYRNFQRRIDVCFPILDDYLKSQLLLVVKNYLSDNQKAVRLDTYQNNILIPESGTKVRAQEANYKLVDRIEHKTPTLFAFSPHGNKSSLVEEK